MTGPGPTERKLPSWLNSFCELLEGAPSPQLFIKWAGIATLAGAMERRLWTHSYNMNLYPNLFIFLVGSPGGGKTVPIKEAVRPLWKSVPEFFVSPTSMTSASLSDDLNSAKRHIIRPAATPPYVEFNSLLIALNELSVMFPSYDAEIMNRFTDLYDCDVYEETRRAKSIKISIPHAQVNIIAATTPSYLNELLPAGAWDQGFISRVIMIFSAEKIVKPLFEIRNKNLGLFKSLSDDLRVIERLYGKFRWEEEAAKAIEAWNGAGGPPTPDHPKLQHYSSRRTAHLLKLCMVCSMSRLGNELLVTIEDYQLALNWLLEAEFYMPDIFRSMVTGGDSAVMDDCFHFIFTSYMRTGKPLPEHKVVHYLSQHVPGHAVMRILENMFRSNMIEVADRDAKGGNLWKPLARLEG